MANPYPITPRQLNLVDLSGSHLTEQGVYPDIKMGVVASYNVSSGSAETVLKSTASGGLTLGSLNVQGNSTLRNVLPESPDTYDLGSSINLWRKGWLSELDTILFAENTASLVGGWLIIGKNQGSIPSFVDSTDTTIDFGKTMIVGGSVVLRSSLQVEYIGTGSLASGSTVYNVVRDLDGSGANDWVEGSVFLELGESGDGRIELNAYDTPRIQMIQQGETYNQQKEIIRIGDLNGNWNYSSEEWGVAIGSYGSGSGNVTIDSENGVRINIYDTPIMEFKSTGAFISNVLNMTGANAAIAIGATPPTSATAGTGLWLDKTGLFALNSNTQKAVLDDVGLQFGNVSGEFLSWLNDDGINLTCKEYTYGGAVPTSALGSQISWVNPFSAYSGDLPFPVKMYATATEYDSNIYTNFTIDVNTISNTNSYFKLNLEDLTITYPKKSAQFSLSNTYGSIYFTDRISNSSYRNWGLQFKNDKSINIISSLTTTYNSYSWFPLFMGQEYVEVEYVSSTSIRITKGDFTHLLFRGVKLKISNPSYKYFVVISSSYDSETEKTTLTLSGDTVTSFTTNTFPIYYSHAAEADGMSYGSSTFIPLTTPLTSTSWDGDSFSTTAKTKIDLSAVFGVPAGVKAVSVYIDIRDSASASTDSYIYLDPTNTSNQGLVWKASEINDRRTSTNLIVPCDANGDIYYQIVASGTNTMDVWLRIHGYWI